MPRSLLASRRFVMPSAAIVAIVQVGGSFGAASNQPDRSGIDLLAVVLLLLGPAGLAVRDRAPLVSVGAAFVAAQFFIGLGYPYGPVFLSVIVAIFDAVQRGRRTALWWVIGTGTVGVVLIAIVDPGSDGLDLVPPVIIAGWALVVIAVAELVRTRREEMAARRRSDEEQRRSELGAARLRLAHELHDVLAHSLSVINVQSSVALHLLDEQPERARPALATIKATSHDALGEVRRALEALRDGTVPTPLTPAPGLDDVGGLVETARKGGLDVELSVDIGLPPLAPAVGLATYRIVQEALTNVVRHAGASTVDVRVGRDGTEREFVVAIVDDGIGGLPEPGIGLASMRERAESTGGRLEAGPASTGGFRVCAHLPIEHPVVHP